MSKCIDDKDLPQNESMSQHISGSHKCQWLWSLWFYNGAVTAAVIVLAITGSIHIQTIDEKCKIMSKVEVGTNGTEIGEWQLLTPAKSRLRRAADDNSEDDIVETNITISQTVYINRLANKELYLGEQGNILLIEFQKGLVSYYNSEDDVCNIESELDPRLADVKDLDNLLDHILVDGGTFIVEHNEFEVGELVTDKTRFPQEVVWLCAGKDAYLLHKVGTVVDDQESGAVGLSPCTQTCYPGPVYCCERRWYGLCKRHCRDTVCSSFCT